MNTVHIASSRTGIGGLWFPNASCKPLAYAPYALNKTEVRTCQSQKLLGLILDDPLNFIQHINSKISKCDKLIGIIKKMSISFPRNALLRTFIRPHLDYADIIYDEPNNASFN